MKYTNYINIIILAVACLLGAGNAMLAQSQKSWQWVEQLGGKSWDISGGLTCTAKNNLFVAGSFSDTLVCSNKKLASAGGHDLFIARFDPKGNLKDLWRGGGQGNDHATCIACSTDNNVIVGGIIAGNVTFDEVTHNGRGTQLYVASLTGKGKFAWVSTLLPSGKATLSYLGTDASGSIYAAGTFADTLTAGGSTVTSSGKKDIFLARISATGRIEKLIALGGKEDDLLSALSVSDSAMIILAGTTGGSFTVGTLQISATKQNRNRDLNSDAFLVSFSDDLNPLWKTQIPGDEFCKISSLGMNTNNDIYAAGSFNMNIRVEDTLLASNGYSDGFLLKYSSTGKLIWARSFGTWYYDYAHHLTLDNLEGAIITGSMGDTLIIDSLTINPVSSKNAAMAIRFSPSGRATWADCISGNGRNFSNGAILDHNGNLYLTGTFRNTFTKENENITSLGDQDVFLAKYYNCPTSRAEITGDTLLCNGSSIELSVKQGFSQVVWNDTILSTNYITVNTPGRYTVSMLDKRGCVLADTVDVTLAPPADFSLGNDTSLPVENSLLLKAPENFRDYCWQDGSLNRTYLAKAEKKKTGTYTYWLSATDSLGCLASDTINIEFYIAPQWINPNEVQLSVYPNPVDDLLFWSVNVGEPCRFVVEMTDDNGRILYNRLVENYQPGSQMTINFSDIPPGAYYIRLRNNTGQPFGTVNIIRN